MCTRTVGSLLLGLLLILETVSYVSATLPRFPEPPFPCGIQGSNVSGIPSISFDLPLSTNKSFNYTWVVNWCTRVVDDPEDDLDPCASQDNRGAFVQQFTSSSCVTPFHVWDPKYAPKVWDGKRLGRSQNQQGGLNLTIYTKVNGYKSWAEVIIGCDQSLANKLKLDMDSVEYSENEDGDERFRLFFASSCACAGSKGGCVPDIPKRQLVEGSGSTDASFSSSGYYSSSAELDCTVGTRNLNGIPPFSFTLEEYNVGTHHKQNYTYVVGFCSKVKDEEQLCTSEEYAGYLQQYSEDSQECLADFAIFSILPQSYTKTGEDGIYYQLIQKRSNHYKVANVYIACDTDTSQDFVLVDSKQVQVTQVKNGNTTYEVRLKSSCACEGSTGNCKVPRAPPVAPPLSPRDHVISRSCRAGQRDVSSLKYGLELDLPQLYNGKSTDFTWVVNWCNSATYFPEDGNPCSADGDGVVQQFSTNKKGQLACDADFKTFNTIVEVPNGGVVGYGINKTFPLGGVHITAYTQETDKKRHPKRVHIFIQCDPIPLDPKLDMDSVLVATGKKINEMKLHYLEYNFFFNHSCACSGSCVKAPAGVKPPKAVAAPVAAPLKKEPPLGCSTGSLFKSRTFRTTGPIQFYLPQHLVWQHTRQDYTWVVGFCSKAGEAPEGYDLCTTDGGAGYVQQYDDNGCQGDWGDWEAMGEWNGTLDGKILFPSGGINMTLKRLNSVGLYRWAEILIGCDYKAKGIITPAMSEVSIIGDAKDDYTYRLVFNSSCACPHKFFDSKIETCTPQNTYAPAVPKAPEVPFGISPNIRPPPPPLEKVFDCNLGSTVGNIPPYTFDLPQRYRLQRSEPYTWTLNFCHKEAENDECTDEFGRAYFQQYTTDGSCVTNFNKIESVSKGKDIASRDTIQIVYSSQGSKNHWKFLTVIIACSKLSADKNIIRTDMTDVMVDGGSAVGKNTTYTAKFASSCACQGTTDKCVPVSAQSTVPVSIDSPIPEEVIDDCVTGVGASIKFGKIPSVLSYLPQGGMPMSDQFYWGVSWCRKAYDIDGLPANITSDVCSDESGAGFLQQLANGTCSANFNRFLGISAVQQGTKVQNYTFPKGGLRIRVATQHVKGRHNKIANVYVACDTRIDNRAEEDMEEVFVFPNVTADAYEYVLFYRSACACPHHKGCEGEFLRPAPVYRAPKSALQPRSAPVPVTIPDRSSCAVNGRSFKNVPPITLFANQSYGGVKEEFVWQIGWCSRLQAPPAGLDDCKVGEGGAGFVWQYDGKSCVSDANEFVSVAEWLDKSLDYGGINITVTGMQKWNSGYHWMELLIACDFEDSKNVVTPVGNVVSVTGDADGDKVYRLYFKSGCACPGHKGVCTAESSVIPKSFIEEPEDSYSIEASSSSSSDIQPSSDCDLNLHVNGAMQLYMPQNHITMPNVSYSKENYTWVIGFCGEIVNTPEGIRDICTVEDGRGYAQQYTGNHCAVDFDIWGGAKRYKDGDESGIRITSYSRPPKTKKHWKVMVVDVKCGQDRVSYKSVVAVSATVNVTGDSRKGENETYYLKLTSSCACEGSKYPCSPKNTFAPLPPAPSAPELDDTDTCAINGRNLTALKSNTFRLLTLNKKTQKVENYTWTVNWCGRDKGLINKCTDADGTSFLQQYGVDSKGKPVCHASFQEMITDGVEEIANGTVLGGRTFVNGGVHFFVGASVLDKKTAKRVGHYKAAHIYMECDPDDASADATVDMDEIIVDWNEKLDATTSAWEYALYFRSACACPNSPNCGKTIRPPARPAPITPPPLVSCKVGKRDFSMAGSMEFWMPQSHETVKDDYTWVINWCNRSSKSPKGFTACENEGGPGFLQQFDKNGCQTDFNMWRSINVWDGRRNSTKKYSTGLHISVYSAWTETTEHRAEIFIGCEYGKSTGKIRVDMENVTVSGAHGKTKVYSLYFASSCACNTPQKSPCIPIQYTRPDDAESSSEEYLSSSSSGDTGYETDSACSTPNGRNLTDSDQLMLYLPQSYNGELTNYTWVFGFCGTVNKSDEIPFTPCTEDEGKGFLQQYDSGCAADFKIFESIIDVDNIEGKNTNGVLMKYSVKARVNTLHFKVFNVYISCAQDGSADGLIVSDSTQVDVKKILDDAHPGGYNTSYTIYLKSSCACPGSKGGCEAVDIAPPVEEPPVVEDPSFACSTLDGRTLDYFDPTHIRLDEVSLNGKHTPYTWIINWCTKAYNNTFGPSKCSDEQGAGYVQQVDATGKCLSAQNYDDAGTISVIPSSEKYSEGGVQLSFRPDARTPRQMIINVYCDTQRLVAPYKLLSKQVAVTEGAIPIIIGPHKIKPRVYTIDFLSSCACATGRPDVCDGGKAPVAIAPPVAVPLGKSPRGVSPGKAYENLEVALCKKMFSGTSAPLLVSLVTPTRDGWSGPNLWSINFCERIASPELRNADLCPGRSFAEVHSGNGNCGTRFNHITNVQSYQDGVNITVGSSNKEEDSYYDKLELLIRCEEGDEDGKVQSTSESVRTISRGGPVSYQIFLKSSCACKGSDIKCAPVNVLQNFTDSPSSSSSALPPVTEEKCNVDGSGNLEGTQPIEFSIPQLLFRNGVPSTEEYVWVFGFCTPIDKAPIGDGKKKTICDKENGLGYLQQYKGPKCASDFDRWNDISPWDGIDRDYDGDGTDRIASSGMRIRAWAKGNSRPQRMVAYIGCDASSEAKGKVLLNMTEVKVYANGNKSYDFYLYFRSSCACEGSTGKCIPVHKYPDPEITETPEPPIPADSDLCNIGDLSLGGLGPFNDGKPVQLTQIDMDKAKPDQAYNWTIGFCKKSDFKTSCTDDDGDAFVQQFDNKTCYTNFRQPRDVYTVEKNAKYTFPDMTVVIANGGVEIVSFEDNNEHTLKVAHVVVECDLSLIGETELKDLDEFGKEFVLVRRGDALPPRRSYDYFFFLRSRCACPNVNCSIAPSASSSSSSSSVVASESEQPDELQCGYEDVTFNKELRTEMAFDYELSAVNPGLRRLLKGDRTTLQINLCGLSERSACAKKNGGGEQFSENSEDGTQCIQGSPYSKKAISYFSMFPKQFGQPSRTVTVDYGLKFSYTSESGSTGSPTSVNIFVQCRGSSPTLQKDERFVIKEYPELFITANGTDSDWKYDIFMQSTQACCSPGLYCPSTRQCVKKCTKCPNQIYDAGNMCYFKRPNPVICESLNAFFCSDDDACVKDCSECHDQIPEESSKMCIKPESPAPHNPPSGNAAPSSSSGSSAVGVALGISIPLVVIAIGAGIAYKVFTGRRKDENRFPEDMLEMDKGQPGTSPSAATPRDESSGTAVI